MTAWIWAVPASVGFLMLVAVAFVAARTAEAARDLEVSLRRLGTLRPALVEVRSAGRTLQHTARSLYNR